MVSRERLLKVVDIEPLITQADGFEMGALNCILENGDVVTLYNVPLDITRAIARLIREDEIDVGYDDFRDSIYELLIMVQPKLAVFHESIDKVVIDGFDRTLGTYSASVYMDVDGISLKRTLIPSHAIFVALLFNKPVFVTDYIIEISKELEQNEEGEGFEYYDEDEEADFFEDEDFDEEY